MILDQNLLLDTAAAITATATSTNVIDLAAARDMGIGDDPALKVLCLVNTTFTTTNSGTLQVSFQGSTDNTTWDTYVSSPAYAAATLTAGTRLLDIDVPRPAAGKSTPRYLRLNYTVANAFTAGKVTAGLVLGRADQPVLGGYPSGFSVSN